MADSDITQKVQDLKNQYFHRDARIREFYEMRRIMPVNVEKYESAKVNDPKNIIRLGTYLLSALPAKHRIPAMGTDAAEIEKAAVVERAVSAAWREQDMRRRRAGQRLWRWAFSDFLITTGWYAVLMNVRKRDDGSPMFLAEVWNPGRTWPEWDGEELTTVVYEYNISRTSVAERAKRFGWDAPSTGGEKNVKVQQLWELKGKKVMQSILLDSHIALNRKEMEGLDRIPVITGAASGEGAWGGSFDGDVNWDRHYGEGILEPVYEMIKQEDRFLTYQMQSARDAAQSPVKHLRGMPGNVTPEHLEGQAIIELQGQQEDVQRLESPPVPPAIMTTLGTLGEKVQQGAFVWSLFGSTGALNLSGFAIQQLLTSAYSTVGEYHETAKSVISEIDKYWLEEYRKGDFGPMMIVGKASNSPALVKEEFTKDMIPEDVYVDVDFSLAAPKDTFERMAAARQAHPEGNLMDVVTTLDEIVGAEDPATILKRLDDETATAILAQILEPLKAVEVLRRKEKALREGVNPDPELADAIKARWMTILSGMAPQEAEGGQGPNPPGTALSSPEARGEPRNIGQQLFGEQAPQAAGAAPATPPSLARRQRGG